MEILYAYWKVFKAFMLLIGLIICVGTLIITGITVNRLKKKGYTVDVSIVWMAAAKSVLSLTKPFWGK